MPQIKRVAYQAQPDAQPVAQHSTIHKRARPDRDDHGGSQSRQQRPKAGKCHRVADVQKREPKRSQRQKR